MSLGGCIRAWIILLALEIVFTLAFVPPARLRALIAAELTASRVVLGERDTDRVVSVSNEAFTTVLEAWPALNPEADSSRDALQWLESPMQGAQRGIAIVRERVHGLLFLALYRLNWMREALIPLIACVAAAAVDGLAVRRRRAFTFATTSTALYNAASYFVLSASMLPLLYLFAPIALPAAVLPLAGLAVAAAVWTFCAHLPGAAPIIGLRT